MLINEFFNANRFVRNGSEIQIILSVFKVPDLI